MPGAVVRTTGTLGRYLPRRLVVKQAVALTPASSLAVSAAKSWATSAGVRRRMQALPAKDTTPELQLRRALHCLGLRYRVHRRLLSGLNRYADIVFGPARVVVDVRGCYWHGCATHYKPAAVNAAYWHAKIERNMARDRETEKLLAAAGWLVLIVWEHEDAVAAAARVAEAVEARRRPPASV